MKVIRCVKQQILNLKNISKNDSFVHFAGFVSEEWSCIKEDFSISSRSIIRSLTTIFVIWVFTLYVFINGYILDIKSMQMENLWMSVLKLEFGLFPWIYDNKLNEPQNHKRARVEPKLI